MVERRAELDALRGAERLDAEDALEVRHHRREAAGAVRGHRDVVLLVGARSGSSWSSRGCARCLFSLISAAVVTSAIMKPELRPGFGGQERRQVVGERRVDHQRDPALGDGADLGDGQRDDVGGEGDRLGVEVAARDDGVLEHQRVVGGGVRLDRERRGGLAQQVHRGAGHLRLAADAVGVLHAGVARRGGSRGSPSRP